VRREEEEEVEDLGGHLRPGSREQCLVRVRVRVRVLSKGGITIRLSAYCYFRSNDDYGAVHGLLERWPDCDSVREPSWVTTEAIPVGYYSFSPP